MVNNYILVNNKLMSMTIPKRITSHTIYGDDSDIEDYIEQNQDCSKHPNLDEYTNNITRITTLKEEANVNRICNRMNFLIDQ
jgi:hypothetical protein